MSVKKSVNALNSFKNSVGCFVKDGKLTPAFSGEKVGDGYPSGVEASVRSNILKGCLFANTNELYLSVDLKRFMKMTSVGGGGTPFIVESVRSNGTEIAVIWDKTVLLIQDGKLLPVTELSYGLTCGVMHCGRLFGVDSGDAYTLRWSRAGNMENGAYGLHASGYITLSPDRGKILDLTVFKGKLVAVREYGLTLLSLYGSPEKFSVDFTDTDCDKIYKKTVQTVANKLYFYSDSGLKWFDGSKISAVELHHAISSPTASGEYAGKYYLAGTSPKLNRKVILCVDLSDGESCIIDVPAETLLIKDGVYYSHGTTFYKLIEGAKYSFVSGALDFGTGGLKTVSKIDVQGKADLRISNG